MEVYHARTMDHEFLDKLRSNIKRINPNSVAIKLHLGEPGNKTALKPKDIKPITIMLKELNIDFFLYDTSVTHSKQRSNAFDYKNYALEKGWAKLGTIIIDGEFITVKEKYLSYEVSKQLCDSDCVLVISHFKGHLCSGFSGAIKNIGMGSLSKKSKTAIYDGGAPTIVAKCIKCHKCETACPICTLKVNDKPVIGTCCGCSDCIYACKDNVLKAKVAPFDILLAESAAAAKKSCKKIIYINICQNITKLCDCESDPKEIICPNTGFLLSLDPVAIDYAAYLLCKLKAKEDVFLKYNKKSGIEQINAAEQMKLGTKNHKLIKLP